MPNRPTTFGRKRPPQRQGGSATLRDRSRDYERFRASMLAAEPLCRYCRARGQITAARVLDHVLALSLGGTNDRGNLCPACVDCNAAKGADELRYLRRGYDIGSVRHDPAMAEWFRLARFSPLIAD